MGFSDPQNNVEQFNLGRGMHVADLGAGTGFYSLAAASAVGGEGKVYAIDIQKTLLDRIKAEAQKEGLTNIEVVWGDIERLNGTRLRDGAVDAVIASNILFQVPDKEGCGREISRITRKGGKLLIIDWSGQAVLGPRAEDVFSAEKARELFGKNNFAFEKEIRAGDHHYGLIFKKQ